MNDLLQAATLLVLLIGMSWGSAAAWLAVYVIGREGLGTNSALFVGLLLAGRSLVGAAFQPLAGGLADRSNRGPFASQTANCAVP